MPRPFILLAALSVLAGCNHDKPFQQEDFSSDTTRTRGADRQLTYNAGTDRTPAWRSDGSALLYSFEDLSRTDRDRCMGELPGTGGSIRQIVCPGTFESADSTDALYEAAVGPDGRVLYLREASPIDAVTASTAALVLGQADDPLNHATVVRPYPYTAGNGTIHQGISNIRWLSGTRAVYLAEKVQYLSTCGGCPLDTVRTGIEMVQVDLSGSSPALSIIPNTLETSSISSGPDSDLVYFTKNGDSRVYQLTFSTGDQSIVHDFGFPLIARDVQVRGTDLFAIVGGRVSHVQDPVLGSVQRDEGGQLREVDLTNGTSVPRIVNGRFFRRPALSPSGNHLAAEAFAATITQCGAFCADTTISKTSDLWLFDLP